MQQMHACNHAIRLASFSHLLWLWPFQQELTGRLTGCSVTEAGRHGRRQAGDFAYYNEQYT